MRTREEIEIELASSIGESLTQAIEAHGFASILFSGGSTPVGLFKQLSFLPIQWKQVFVSLVDERILPKSHKDLNANLVREFFLKNYSKEAQFVPLVNMDLPIEFDLSKTIEKVAVFSSPFTVTILGMGGDGHTASLFPESPQLDEGMDLQTEERLILTDPETAPYQRVTFTRKALLNSERLILHCYGRAKKDIMEKAQLQEGYLPFPIGGFMNIEDIPLEIYWTE